MRWRLGLDMGTNSIGWVVIALNNDNKPISLRDMGVRIFPDGRKPATNGRVGESCAVERRTARGMRRNRDRRINRKKYLARLLTKYGLLPFSGTGENKQLFGNLKNTKGPNPYELRARAAEKAVQPYELGRALFHLGQRRGFKSNRKTGAEEDGQFYGKIHNLRDELAGQTLGAYLWKEVQRGKPVRFRGEENGFYPDRKMYEDEFTAIRERQESHHSLTSEEWDNLHDAIFHQNPLKDVERGKCRFYTKEDRAYSGLPIAQKYRIIQDINNLEWIEQTGTGIIYHKLSDEQRLAIFNKLHQQVANLKWDAIRKLKGKDGSNLFPDDCKFNFESSRPSGFVGNKPEIDLAKAFGDRWQEWSEAEQNDIAEYLYEAEEEDAILNKAAEWGVDESTAKAVAKVKLPQRTMSVSRKFMEDIVPIMRETGKRYDEAIKELKNEYGQPLNHTPLDEGIIDDELPYYGQVIEGSTLGAHPEVEENAETDDTRDAVEYKYGRINNPTVHVALNQLRKLVNRLIKAYGHPEQIHIELSRDLKKSKKERDEINAEISANERENQRRAKIFQDLHNGQEPSALDLKKIKLWEELGKDEFTRKCVFSGETISAAALFNGEAEIEHILPWSRTLDDSMSNLTVSLRHANRIKKNDTPYEARLRFAALGWAWEDIVRRAANLPDSKRWRFTEDAMSRFEKENGFIARQLNDNAYISKVAKRYLGRICNPDNIVSSPGRLTALLRGKWHLNTLLNDHNHKQRNDHRHHAIDALVVGLTERSVLNEISRQSGRGADDRMRIVVPDLPIDREEVRQKLEEVVVSHKRDHTKNQKFFKDGAYGFVNQNARDKEMPDHNLVITKELTSLSETEILCIRDKVLRSAIKDFVNRELCVDLELAARHSKGLKTEEEKTLQKQYKSILKKSLPMCLHRFGYEVWPAQKAKKRKGENSPDMRPPLKRVRILVSNQSVKSIPSAPYKGYVPDSYVCCDIYRVPKGEKGNWKKKQYEWKGEFRSHIDMLKPPKDLNQWKPHPAAKHVMRLYKNDMVSLNENGKETYMRVASFSATNNKLDLRPHTEAVGAQKKYVSINTLQDKGLKKVKLTEDGKIEPFHHGRTSR